MSACRWGVLVAVLVALGAGTGRAPAAPPPEAEYSEAYFKAADGTTLHADVLRPRGVRRTPVLLIATPYNSHSDPFFSGGNPVGQPPNLTFLPRELQSLKRGYAVVQVDLRGFGASGGCWDNGGPGEQADVKAAVEWAASQEWSTGNVAVIGVSYEGWTGIQALATAPRGLRAVVAMQPVAEGYLAYYTNGLPLLASPGFQAGYPLLTTAPGSVYDQPPYHQSWLSGMFASACGAETAAASLDPDPSVPYWRERELIERAARSDVPVFVYGGFHDQNAAPQNQAALAPRLRELRGLWWAQTGHEMPARDKQILAQIGRFLDRTVKQERAAVDDPGAVVQEAPSLRWREERAWPPGDARQSSLALLPGSYRDERGNVGGDDVWSPQTGTIPFSRSPVKGQGTWTFSHSLPHAVHLAGLPRLRAQVEGPASGRLVGLVYDVSPDGSALLITRGGTLIRDGRVEIDLFPQDWRVAAGHRIGVLISGSEDGWWIPTPGSGEQVNMRSGSLALPALRCVRDRFVEGAPGPRWEAVKHPVQIEPGTIEQRTVEGALPSEQESGGACTAIVPPARACLARRSPIGARNIGRIRLGYSRRRLLRLPVKPVRRARRSYRYCVKRSRGRVTAVFSSRSRVRLVTTTARGHGNRRVRVGSRAASFRRAYSSRRRIGRGLYRAGPSSPRLFGLGRGRVRFIAVADRRLLRNRGSLRRHLRLAGL